MQQAQRARRPLEVALLDHHTPQCDGVQLGRMLVQDPQFKATRLVLLNSAGQRGKGELFGDSGFAGYLLKPVSQRDLLRCLTLTLAKPADAWHE